MTIVEDQTGLLVSKKMQSTSARYRGDKATFGKNREPICSLSDILKTDAYKIAS